MTRTRWLTLLPFLLTLLIIPLSDVYPIGEAEAGPGRQTTEIARSDYLLTQFRVIVTYLRLLVFPVNQNLDYDYPIYHSFFQPPVFLSFLFLASLLALAVFLLFSSRLTLFASRLTPSSSRLTAFGLLWFFLTLSVESSIIPIRDVLFEHRLYLPSVGFLLAVIISLEFVVSKVTLFVNRPAFAMSLIGGLVVLLSIATYQRNAVWKDEIRLWMDTTAKSPQKVRPLLNLGKAYQVQGRLEEALREFQTAFALRPDAADIHFNVGNVYQAQGRLEEALAMYRRSLTLKPYLQPQYVQTHNNLGVIYKAQGRIEEAIREYQTALRLDPSYALAHYNLGGIYKDQGRLEEALRQYQIAIKLDPDDVETRNNLGVVLQGLGRLDEAIRAFQAALARRPDHVSARNNLGVALKNQGRLEGAIQEFQAVLERQPDLAIVHRNLADAYLLQGRIDDAIREYQKALSIQPDSITRYNLGVAYQRAGLHHKAREAFEETLQSDPQFKPAQDVLESMGQSSVY